MPAIVVLRYVLLAATVAMIGLHLCTTLLLKRGVRAVTLLRVEIAYYVLLLVALAFPAFRIVLAPAVVLAGIHAAAWMYSEVNRDNAVPSRPVLIGVQVFDSGEAVALAWIAYGLVRAATGGM